MDIPMPGPRATRAARPALVAAPTVVPEARTGRRASTDSRYYDFRTHLVIAEQSRWFGRLDSIVCDWLSSKADGIEPGRDVLVRSESADASVAHAVVGGRDVARYVLMERGDQGIWRSEIIAASSGEDAGWCSIHIANSTSRFASRPKVVSEILGSIEVQDGGSDLIDDSWIVGPAQVGELVAVLRDEDRALPVFLAATADGGDVGKLADWARPRMRELAGLAHRYILDPAARRLLEEEMGPYHAVVPGTIRSFAPRPVPRDRTDARRHRTLGADRLSRMGHRAAATFLGRIARFEVAATPETADVRDVRRAFEDKDAQEIFNRARRRVGRHDEPTPAGSEPRTGHVPGPAEPTPERPLHVAVEESVGTRDPAPSVDTPTTDDRPHAAGAGAGTVAAAASSRVLAELRTLFEVDDLEEVVVAARMYIEAVSEAEGAMTAVRASQRESEDQARENRLLLEEYERELADERERRETAEATARLAWTHLGTTNPDESDIAPAAPVVPKSFSAIVSAIDDHLDAWVVFTGDRAVTEDLDDIDTQGNGAANCWRALNALADYARCVEDGSWSGGDFRAYVERTPEGRASFEPGKVAMGESLTVRSNTRMSRARLFGVPQEVDPSGRAHMWAHLRLLKIGMESPRLHFLDDTAGTGRVYVGYIGPHLEIASTN